MLYHNCSIFVGGGRVLLLKTTQDKSLRIYNGNVITAIKTENGPTVRNGDFLLFSSLHESYIMVHVLFKLFVLV